MHRKLMDPDDVMMKHAVDYALVMRRQWEVDGGGVYVVVESLRKARILAQGIENARVFAKGMPNKYASAVFFDVDLWGGKIGTSSYFRMTTPWNLGGSFNFSDLTIKGVGPEFRVFVSHWLLESRLTALDKERSRITGMLKMWTTEGE